MKPISILLFLLIQTTIISGQCNVQVNNRPDGTTVRYLNPELVGKGNNCELGLSVQTDGSSYYVSTTVRYLSTPKKQTGSLMIQLTNNQSLQLELVTSQLATMHNEQIGMGIYSLTAADVQKLKNSTIKTVVFRESTGNNQVVTPSQNKDILQRHINCLSR